jgi:hypothetical protein
MRFPIERVAVTMDVAEFDFKRACRLLGFNPVDMLKEVPDLVVRDSTSRNFARIFMQQFW